MEMLPRERIRPLYRAALEDRGRAHGAEEDPLEVLVEYCARLLPLPPFRVWAEDVDRFPEAHVQDLAESIYAPTPAAPVTAAELHFSLGGAPWSATLRAFRSDDAWRGFIVFRGAREASAHRTAVIFCEPELEHIRDRFLSFDSASLEAFLRSCAA